MDLATQPRRDCTPPAVFLRGAADAYGIPAVLCRFVQQCIAQVLQEIWDHTFSEYSFGYRPGRSQAQAVEQFRKHVEAGFTYVVSIDLSKFFDRVNHDRPLHTQAAWSALRPVPKRER